MIETNYCNREDALTLYETLQNEQDRDTFLYGFYSAISFAHYLSLDDVEKSIYMLASIVGHSYPVYYGFKGGKGIATSLGVILAIQGKIGVICLIFALLLMLSSRMVSLGSIFAAFLYPVLVAVIGNVYGEELQYKLPYFIFACFIAVLAIFRHRKNITRLLNGTENKLWKTKKEKAAAALAEEAKEEEGK
jgi:acyl-phosphate glycerol 3-phosphate acyltransferase